MEPRIMTQSITTDFPATRTAALERLSRFVPHAGADYARMRNHDFGAGGHRHVSTLSPYLRHRLLTETEVLEAVLGRHSPQAAEKFVQEVYWRSYWKGWLEQRPAVWEMYRSGLTAALDQVQTQSGLRRAWADACGGQTGIDAFDHWAQELRQTGYLHNHARMWFASIWIFTLRLPWELGADFFMRHLLDGDTASNTLGWRWVAGLQTRGKTYLARPDNIETYTDGRFRPKGLASVAIPLDGPEAPRIALLTSSLSRPDADRLRAELAAGRIDWVVGTHALVQETVRFRRLAQNVDRQLIQQRVQFRGAARGAIAGCCSQGQAGGGRAQYCASGEVHNCPLGQ